MMVKNNPIISYPENQESNSLSILIGQEDLPINLDDIKIYSKYDIEQFEKNL